MAVSNIKLNLVSHSKELATRQYNNTLSFELRDFFRSNDFPFVEVLYVQDDQRNKEVTSLLVPITKFVKVQRKQDELF